MNQREKIIAIVLVLVAIVWGKVVIFKQPKKMALAVPAQKVLAPTLPSGTAAKGAEVFTLHEALARGAMKMNNPTGGMPKDPFKKFTPRKKSRDCVLESSDLVLTGIMWQQNDPVALINDEVLKVGDTFSGFKVESIQENEVVLSQGEQSVVLKLFAPTEEK